MSQVEQGQRVVEKGAEHLDSGIVVYQCGSGGIQSPGAEPAGTDVSIVDWGDYTTRVATEDLIPFGEEVDPFDLCAAEDRDYYSFPGV